MPKVNLRAIPRKTRKEYTRSFTDSNAEGEEITLTLKAPDFASSLWIEERVGEYQEVHAANDMVYVTHEGEEVPLTATLIQVIAALEGLQLGPKEERYTFVDLIYLMLRMPEAWLQITGWLSGIAEEGAAKNFVVGGES